MPNTGTKKKAPKNMTDKMSQFCLDCYQIDDVLNSIPDDILIFGAVVKAGMSFSKMRINVPKDLKKLGVTHLRKHLPQTEATFTFDEVTKRQIKRAVTEGCKIVGIDPSIAYFQSITLSNGKGNGRFQRTTKEIHPDDTDYRRKLVVLGLTDGEGKVQSLMADLSAKKYECKIEHTTVRTIICAKMT